MGGETEFFQWIDRDDTSEVISWGQYNFDTKKNLQRTWEKGIKDLNNVNS